MFDTSAFGWPSGGTHSNCTSSPTVAVAENGWVSNLVFKSENSERRYIKDFTTTGRKVKQWHLKNERYHTLYYIMGKNTNGGLVRMRHYERHICGHVTEEELAKELEKDRPRMGR